ncbi:HNH endonuclease [Kineosporiaceae bacterium SCSIO 59966]|nr:HNH endonuclease [Kineosporiaceae bacterium SCSIO 59966]
MVAGLTAIGVGSAVSPTPDAAPLADVAVAPDAAGTRSPPPTTTAPSPTTTPPQPPPSSPAPSAGSVEEQIAGAGDATALALLGTLEVKGRAPRTGYDRDLFGPRWADTDRNGCDTRNDTLRRDLTDVVLKPGTNGCVVLSGSFVEPYSGAHVDFVRGQGTSELVQIDHVVALSDAWQKGAQQWTPQRRLAFANDPLNLLAVDGALNQQKGDGDAATWLPPNKAFRCAYVARQVAVKVKYDAWVTAAERGAVARVLSACPDEPVPSSDAPVEAPIAAPPAPALAPTTPAATSDCDPAYPDVCIPPPSQVGDLDCGDIPRRRFTVLAPDPHRLDGRDNDGIGCES